jgi:hypothetical protein
MTCDAKKSREKKGLHLNGHSFCSYFFGLPLSTSSLWKQAVTVQSVLEKIALPGVKCLVYNRKSSHT